MNISQSVYLAGLTPAPSSATPEFTTPQIRDHLRAAEVHLEAKMRTIRATAELQHSILGDDKRTDADNYGDGELLRHLLEVLIEAATVSHWGS